MPKSKTLEEYKVELSNLRKQYEERGLELETLKRSYNEYIKAHNYLKRNNKRVVPKPVDHPDILRRNESLRQYRENSNYYQVLTHIERKRDQYKKQQRRTVRVL